MAMNPHDDNDRPQYHILNYRTGAVTHSKLTDLKRARNKVDKLDSDYGACAHCVVNSKTGFRHT